MKDLVAAYYGSNLNATPFAEGRHTKCMHCYALQNQRGLQMKCFLGVLLHLRVLSDPLEL